MPTTSPSFPVILAIGVAVAGTLVTIALSVVYLRFVRMDRPVIGTWRYPSMARSREAATV